MHRFPRPDKPARTAWLAALVLALLPSLATAAAPALRDGDLIFQTSRSSQSQAVQLATRSRYSHMGMVFVQGGQTYVYEAAGRVQLTPLAAWTARGIDGHYVVKRLRDADQRLDAAARARLWNSARQFRGRPYDLYFQWSDERIYCSELVWKVYHQALGLDIGQRQKLRDFDLTAPAVQAQMRERYGNAPPLDEPVISPAAMFESELLITVGGH